jgi:NhaC family Na+:H+ antiporter
LGVGEVLGYPAGLTVGAIVSGAYIGDKMSPVSDTTNVASAITDTNLFRHIYSMMYTTLPAAVLCLIIYGVISLQYGGGQLPSELEVVMAGLAENFNLSIVTLFPPILLIILAAVFRAPAIPTLVISIFAGAIVALIFQNIGFTQLLQVATSGFVPETGIELIDGLLKRGGIESMFFSVALMICALILGGVLEGTKVLDTLVNALLKKVKTVGGLIASVLASCYLLLAGTGNVFVSIIVTGRAFSSAFKEKKIESSVLSRTLEDAATVGSPLIPWSLAAIFTSGVLQISPMEFIPFTFLGMLVPIFSIIYGLTGFAIFKEKEEQAVDDGKDMVSST